jgi:two-component system, OmpR family, response regulator
MLLAMEPVRDDACRENSLRTHLQKAGLRKSSEPTSRSAGRAGVAGIIISDIESERERILAFLADYHVIYSYTLSNYRHASHNLVREEVQFLVLGGANRNSMFDALDWIRAQSNVAVIIIGPANEQECVAALDRGADDYVTETVSLRELLARIRVILRYERSTWSQARQVEAFRYVFAGWTYDHLTQRLTNGRSARIALSQMDCALLKAFLDAPQRVLSREHLVRATRTGKDICDRSVNVRIVRLRRKLRAGGASQDIIRAQRGLGYVFTVPVVRQPTSIAEIPRDHVGRQKEGFTR